MENLAVKIHHVDADVPKSCATKEHQDNEQIDEAGKTEVVQIELVWEHKTELVIAHWAHEILGHLGRDEMYR